MDEQSLLALGERVGNEYLGRRLRLQVDRMARYRGRGRGKFHFENMARLMKALKVVLRVTGLLGVGQRNALQLTVRTHRVPVAGLPAPLAGLRLLQITDLHLDGYAGLGAHIARVVAGERYDVCLLTGDYRYYATGTYRHIEAELDALLPTLACRLGVYGILGNHDFIEMVPILESAGVHVLLNESACLTVDGANLWVVGLDDAHFYGLHDFDKGLAGVPYDEPRILMVHSPEVIPEASARSFALYLAGHTHGGQICLPGGWPPYVNARCPRRYVAGAWDFHGMAGYTSYGAGSSGVFARFFCPPEIVIHELVPG
jgi:uncharacterized protein